jgi:hypothetical protein
LEKVHDLIVVIGCNAASRLRSKQRLREPPIRKVFAGFNLPVDRKLVGLT